MEIFVNVTNQKLSIASSFCNAVSGSQEFVKFKYILGDEWNGLTVFAQFGQNGAGYNQYLDENNCVYLPAEINPGICTMMLYGTGSNTIATTNYINLKIESSAYISDASSTEISQTLYTQLINRIDNLIDAVDGYSSSTDVTALEIVDARLAASDQQVKGSLKTRIDTDYAALKNAIETVEAKNNICRFLAGSPAQLTMTYDATNNSYTVAWIDNNAHAIYGKCGIRTIKITNDSTDTNNIIFTITNCTNDSYVKLVVDVSAKTMSIKPFDSTLSNTEYVVSVFYTNNYGSCFGNEYFFKSVINTEQWNQDRYENYRAKKASIIGGRISVNTTAHTVTFTDVRACYGQSGQYTATFTSDSPLSYASYTGNNNQIWHLYFNRATMSYELLNNGGLSTIRASINYNYYYYIASFLNGHFYGVESVRDGIWFVDGKDDFPVNLSSIWDDVVKHNIFARRAKPWVGYINIEPTNQIIHINDMALIYGSDGRYSTNRITTTINYNGLTYPSNSLMLFYDQPNNTIVCLGITELNTAFANNNYKNYYYICTYVGKKYYDIDIKSNTWLIDGEDYCPNLSPKTIIEKHSSKIFKKVVCCGDSYTAGYIVDDGGTPHLTNEEFSWVHYMANKTGNTWVNCGISGANVFTWQTRGGIRKAQDAGLAQAYIIGLGINDSSDASDTSHHVDIGTVDDIGTTNNTYYAGLSSIIRQLHAISPKAKIFVQTMASSGSRYTTYNTAIRNVCEAYKTTYDVHLLDLYNYLYMYQRSSITGDALSGHFTASGYEQFAENLDYIMSDYINTHITDFQDVAFIPYELNNESRTEESNATLDAAVESRIDPLTTWKGKNWLIYGDDTTSSSNGNSTKTGWAKYVNATIGFGNCYGRSVSGQSFIWNNSTFKANIQTGEYMGQGTENDNSLGCLCSWQRIKTMIPDNIKDDIDLIWLTGGLNDMLNLDSNNAASNLEYTKPTFISDEGTDTAWESASEYNGGDFDVTKLSGAIASTIMKLQCRCPNAVIILSTPMPYWNTSTYQDIERYGVSMIDIADTEIKTARYMSIPYFDTCSMTGINGFNYDKYMNNVNLQPIEGQKMLARTAVGALRNIYPIYWRQFYNYRIYGNTENGKSVGDRSANLFDKENIQRGAILAGSSYAGYSYPESVVHYAYGTNFDINRLCFKQLFTVTGINTISISGDYIFMFVEFPNGMNSGEKSDWYSQNSPLTIEDKTFTLIIKHADERAISDADIENIELMINSGSTALPYEPYDNYDGYRIPVTTERSVPHTATLQLHDCLPSTMQFDAPEALYYAENGLPAGTYNFTIQNSYDTSYGGGKTYQFTLANDVPAKGQLVFGWAYNTQASAAKITSYASSTSTAAIEQVGVTEGSGGTSLGTTDGNSTNVNHIHRARYGSNNYKESAIRQFLNSSAVAGSVWTPQTKYDRPPSWNSNTAGFMKDIDSDFLAVLGASPKVVALNTVTDGGGSVTINNDKFFLLSRSEVYGGKENNINEGEPYPYYSNYTDLSAAGVGDDSNRIKYRSGTAQIWWLRSPNSAYGGNVRRVGTSGGVYDGYIASYAYGIAPACNIALDEDYKFNGRVLHVRDQISVQKGNQTLVFDVIGIDHDEVHFDKTTVDIYLDEPLGKSGDDTDYIDYKTQKRYNIDGTSEDVTLPRLPVLVGDESDLITVDTQVQPSRIMIRGKVNS